MKKSLVFIVLLCVNLEVFCNSTENTNIEYKTQKNYTIHFYHEEYANYFVIEDFAFACWVWVGVKNFQFDMHHSQLFFKINKNYSAVHVPNGAFQISAKDSCGGVKKISPKWSYIISNNLPDESISYLYIIKNEDIIGVDKIYVDEFIYDKNNVLVKNMYLIGCMKNGGIVYDNFMNFVNSGIMKGLFLKKMNTAMPNPTHSNVKHINNFTPPCSPAPSNP